MFLLGGFLKSIGDR